MTNVLLTEKTPVLENTANNAVQAQAKRDRTTNKTVTNYMYVGITHHHTYSKKKKGAASLINLSFLARCPPLYHLTIAHTWGHHLTLFGVATNKQKKHHYDTQ